MNNKTHSIITSFLFFILFIGLIICAYHIYTINKELDIANAKITKCSIFLNEENVQSLKKEVDTSDWETYRDNVFGFTFLYPQDKKQIRIYSNIEENTKKYGRLETVHEVAYFHCADQLIPDKGQIFVVDDKKTIVQLRDEINTKQNSDNINLEKAELLIEENSNVILYRNKHEHGEQYMYFFTVDNRHFIVSFNEPGCDHIIMEKIIETFHLD